MKEIILKPCPFCGGVAEIDYSKSVISCHDCGMTLKSYSEAASAVEVWNRRVDDDGVLEGLIAVTPSNCREVLPKFSRKQLLTVAIEAMNQLNKTIEDNTKCVSIIEHFERAYKTRDGKQIISALAQVFDPNPVKRSLQ